MKKSDNRGAEISRVSLKPLWRHVKMAQPSSSSDCGGCGSGLGGLVLMDGGSVRRFEVMKAQQVVGHFILATAL